MKTNLMFKVIAAVLTTASPAMAQSTGQSAQPTTSSPSAAAPQTPLTETTLSALTKVCLPVLSGANVKLVATAAGFKLQNGAWSKPVDGQRRLDVDPPDVANPHQCTVTATYTPGGGAELRAALGAWASGQTPPLTALDVNQSVVGAPGDLITSQWSGPTNGGVESLVLSQEKPSQGQGGLDQSTLLVSFTPN